MNDHPARIAVLTVGDELLSGEVADSNLGSIGEALSTMGISVWEHATVRDEVHAISTAINGFLKTNDAVLITGGLGPTSDDVTREAVADATERQLESRKGLETMIHGFFQSLGREMPEENLKQALIPCGARAIPPAGGTAPGFIVDHGGKLIVALPGVPREMERMLQSDVKDELSRRFASGEVTVTLRVNTFGAGESDVAQKLRDLIGRGTVRYGFLARSGPIVVKLTATARSREEAERLAAAERDKVVERLGTLVYGYCDETMEEVVGKLLLEKGLSIAVAESLTAGMVCSRIANVPGSSGYFNGGVVTYSRESKEEVLGLPGELLSEGAVNQGVARAMAESVRRMFYADLGVATTGLAGPGCAGETKPIGTLCLALADGKDTGSWERRLPGDRELVRSIATMAAMNLIRLYVLHGDQVVDD